MSPWATASSSRSPSTAERCGRTRPWASTSCSTRWASSGPRPRPRSGLSAPCGQLSPAQLIDRHAIACRPVRDLLVAYLAERQPMLDHTTLRNLAFHLGGLFWRDLERHHPGIASLRLAPEVSAAWKQRMMMKTRRVVGANGETTEISERRAHGKGAVGSSAWLLPRHRAVGDGGPWPLGTVGRAVPDPLQKISHAKRRSDPASRGWTSEPGSGSLSWPRS